MDKTYQPKAKEVKRSWYLVDAGNQILGRLSTQCANYLTGKNKVSYSQHMDSGGYVVIINAKKIKVTGNKAKNKVYKGHSGYPGGLKQVTYAKMLDEHPERIIYKAISGMLPDNRLKKDRLARLKIYKDDKHPYANLVSK